MTAGPPCDSLTLFLFLAGREGDESGMSMSSALRAAISARTRGVRLGGMIEVVM
jgi:hypothetical protein